jgi:hypothetical protein
MTFAHVWRLSAVAAAAIIWQTQFAQAEEYRIVAADAAAACKSGEKSETMTLDGPRDASVARADGDKLNVAVCVDDNSKSAVNVRWRANSRWSSTGNISEGCVEILGASRVKVRAVDTNFHQTANYYSCVQERWRYRSAEHLRVHVHVDIAAGQDEPIFSAPVFLAPGLQAKSSIEVSMRWAQDGFALVNFW